MDEGRKLVVTSVIGKMALSFFLLGHYGLSMAKDKLDELEGTYSSPSSECSNFNAKKNKFASCKKEFNDCLVIKKINQEKANVEIFSTQGLQHTCSVKSEAKIVNGELVLFFDETEDSQRLHFISNGAGIILKQDVPPGQHSENCGAHASFDGLKFKKISKAVKANSCFSG
ncbi:hypothetical protein ACO0LC_09720 [Undibacterium sp. JH2W]|uniref:hypothetical protein n=1 Tax=Undibacterium sp. JH2W TaxID=3413037 RepID=UPI003BF3F0FA